MRFIRTICAPALVLAVPAFITFQIAARPIASCGKDACELLKQVMPCAMAAVSGAEQSGSGCQKEARPEPAGCCKKIVEPSPCGRCDSKDSKDEPRPLCGKSETSPDCPNALDCPERVPLCGLCPLVPVAAEPAVKSRMPALRVQILPVTHVAITLSADTNGPWNLPKHSPPLTVLARAGPERRVALCSFLL